MLSPAFLSSARGRVIFSILVLGVISALAFAFYFVSPAGQGGLGNSGESGPGASGDDRKFVAPVFNEQEEEEQAGRVARINGEYIYEVEVRKLAAELFGESAAKAISPVSEQWDVAINYLAQRVILEQAATRYGILEQVREKASQLSSYGSADGRSAAVAELEGYFRLLEQEVAEAAYQDRVDVSLAEMREFYENNQERWQIPEFRVLQVSWTNAVDDETVSGVMEGLRSATSIRELDQAIAGYRDEHPGLVYHSSVLREEGAGLPGKLARDLPSSNPGEILSATGANGKTVAVKLLARESHAFPFETVADKIRIEIIGKGHHNLRREYIERLYAEADVEVFQI
ncbi:MAG: hypothetical protein ACLFU4_09730 [Opitutales bacterium]